MKASRWCVVAAAFVLCSAFNADSAGRACVKEKGERGVGYNIDKTKMKEAYAPNGRRMLQDGHRVYTIEVPPLVKRDKPIQCTLSVANGLWQAPSFEKNPFALGNSPFTSHEKPAPDSK